MEGGVGRGSSSRWKALKERLRFKGGTGMGCCGGYWRFRASGRRMDQLEEEEERERDGDEEVGGGYQRGGGAAAAAVEGIADSPEVSSRDPGCDGEIQPLSSTAATNLATALAAERHFRAAAVAAPMPQQDYWEGTGTPLRVSLMRLLAEGGGDCGEEEAGPTTTTGEGNAAWWCCVCMGRRKGAAFIPCGHTFCRVCSREIWLNRGACPLCNRPILDILDIF